MPDKNLIFKKLAEILKQLKYLKQLSVLSEKTLISEETKMYLAERVMERLISAALDINMHVAADLTKEVPEDYFSSFFALAKLKIYPISFAKKIAPSASLRNILVHEYQDINIKKFRAAIKKALVDYSKYAKYIKVFLK